jgi:hypothetical protein
VGLSCNFVREFSLLTTGYTFNPLHVVYNRFNKKNMKQAISLLLSHWCVLRYIICCVSGVETTRRFLLEWLSYTCRYIPVGLLEVVPQRINWRPPSYYGRDDLETLMASDSAADWVCNSLLFQVFLCICLNVVFWRVKDGRVTFIFRANIIWSISFFGMEEIKW